MSTPDEVLAIAKAHLRRVKKSGGDNILACCPFHRKMDGSFENNPSFSLSLTKGVYYCFSCHERGTLGKLLRDIGLGWETVQQKYGETIASLAKASAPKFDASVEVVAHREPIDESFLGMFDFCPTELAEAGFSEQTLRYFDVGYDAHHDRITYPLRDAQGQLMGISGRTCCGDVPRYKVYDREYTVWGLPARDTKKGALLWNAHNVLAASAFTVLDRVVLTEGFKACMWVHQAGEKNVVALLGSFMTRPQQVLLERPGAPIYLMLDNDDAGAKGTLEIAAALSKSGRVFIVDYPGKQPDSLTPEELLGALNSAQNYVQWTLNRLGKKFGN